MEKLWPRLKAYWQRYRAYVLGHEDTSVDRQFLSAVVELQETPPSPTVRYFLIGLCAFIVIALLWAIFGRVDIVAVGQGKIIPSSRVKVIQPLESGVIKAILIEEGQAVKAGQPLLELDLTLTEADRQRLQDELYTTQANVIRINALLNDDKLGFEEEIPASIAQTQTHLYQQGREQHAAEVAALQNQLNQKQHELAASKANIMRLEKTLPLLKQRTESFQRLAAKQFVAKNQALSMEEQLLTQTYELEAERQKVRELGSAVAAAREQLKAAEANFRRNLLTELDEKSQQAGSLQQELAKAEQRNRFQHLASPIDGTVQELRVHTIGGVVTPAQELMKVVPHQDALEAEILIQNKDIGFVKEGDPVRLKLEAFPFTKYGLVEGKVKKLSLDAIQDEDLGLVYAARVSMDKATLRVEDKEVLLSPGLALTGEIKTGSRRIIEYFLSPIAKHTSEAIRER